MIIESASINLGEASLNKGRNYGLLTKLAYLTRYTREFRKSFLGHMESWEEDTEEELVTDISTCYKTVTGNGVSVKTPINSQGRLAQKIINKKEVNSLIMLVGPLQSLDTLLPNQTELGIELTFCENSKFFVTSNSSVKPKLKIKGDILGLVKMLHIFFVF